MDEEMGDISMPMAALLQNMGSDLNVKEMSIKFNEAVLDYSIKTEVSKKKMAENGFNFLSTLFAFLNVALLASIVITPVVYIVSLFRR
jgi:hypothetical protein